MGLVSSAVDTNFPEGHADNGEVAIDTRSARESRQIDHKSMDLRASA
jgi:hypothetical protein